MKIEYYGGNWGDAPRYCRSARRDLAHPDYRLNDFIGFRLILTTLNKN